MDDRDQRLNELEQQVTALQRQLAAQPRGWPWSLGRYAVATVVALTVVASTAVALVSAQTSGLSSPPHQSGHEAITVDTPCANNSICTSTATCSAGKVLHGGGGGVAFVAGAGEPLLSYSGPETSSTTIWTVVAQTRTVRSPRCWA
jgi:hypothetical protein